MSWQGPAFDKCPGLAEQPGSLGVASRWSLILPWVESSRGPATLPTLEGRARARAEMVSKPGEGGRGEG